MFHELSSEPLFAAAFALWALLVVARGGTAVGPSGSLLVGLGVALLALIRPGNAVLLVFALFPFVLRGRLARAGRCGPARSSSPRVLPLAAWAVLNGVRFGDYTLARGGNAVIPFYRAFITDRIVSPDNGPASRRLATCGPAAPADARSVQGVRRDAARGLHERQLPHPRGPLPAVRPGLRLGHELLRPAQGRHRGGARASGQVRVRRARTRSGSSSASRTSARRRRARVARRRRRRRSGRACRRRPRESRSRPARTSGSRGRTTASATSGRRRRTITSSSCKPAAAPALRRDRARARLALRRAAGPARATRQLALRLNQLSRWFPRPILWIAARPDRARLAPAARSAHADRARRSPRSS